LNAVPPSILVTGGAGYLGSQLCLSLRKGGYPVYCLDHLYEEFVKYAFEKEDVNAVQGSVLDAELINTLLPFIDVVIHASVYHESLPGETLKNCSPDRDILYRNNVAAVKFLLKASEKHKVQKFIFLSSYYVYGHGKQSVTEEDEPEPDTIRGILKKEAEQICLDSADSGTDIVVLRLPILYGPSLNMRWESVVHRFIKTILTDESPVIKAWQNETRNFIAIDDAIEVIKEAITSRTRDVLFNVVGCDDFYIVDLARLIINQFQLIENEILQLKHREQEIPYPLFRSCRFDQVFQNIPYRKLNGYELNKLIETGRRTLGSQ